MLSKVCQWSLLTGSKTGGMLLMGRGLTMTSGRMARSAGFERISKSVGIGRRAGPTIRERLLGPSTGKPFIYGTYALAGGSAAGMAMLCYYGLGMSSELGAIHMSALWPEYVRDRIKMTYTYLGGSLAVTAASAMAAARSPQVMRLVSRNSILGLVVSIAAIVGTGALCRSIPYDNGMKHAAWLLHCGVLGAVLAPMCFMGGAVLVRAAWYTAGIAGGLSLTAASAPSEKFLMWGGPLAMGLGVVFVSSIGTFFFPPTTALGAGLMSIAMYGGLLLFSAFLLYDTQRVIKKAEMYPAPRFATEPFDPINAQLSIYMDIINIFIRIAMIMAGQRSQRK